MPTTRRRDADATRARLLEAACTAFGEEGYFGTDSNKIARIAGYAPATFYRHFADKREILLAAYEEWAVTEWAAVQAVLDPSKPQRTVARRLAAAVIDHHRRWSGLRRSLRAAAATDEDVRSFQLRQRREQLEWLASLGVGPSHRARDLALLLELERLCDAIAEKDSKRLGVSDREMASQVERVIREYLSL